MLIIRKNNTIIKHKHESVKIYKSLIVSYTIRRITRVTDLIKILINKCHLNKREQRGRFITHN